MSGAENFIAAIRDAVNRPQPFMVAVGRVYVTAASPGRSAVAEVQGITDSAFQVASESWGSPFKASVAAGSVNGKLAVVLFNQGQPIILCLIG